MSLEDLVIFSNFANSSDSLKACRVEDPPKAMSTLFHILTVIGTKEYFQELILQVGMLKTAWLRRSGFKELKNALEYQSDYSRLFKSKQPWI